jgi:hypothetical protein
MRIVSPDGCYARGRRGVGFLVVPGDEFINSYDGYLGLKPTDRDRLWTNFRYWITQIAVKIPGKCHGYDKTQYGGKYTCCFQFDIRESRFYGFLSHPKQEARNFLYFTAIHHLFKNYKRTEEKVLRRIVEIAQSEDVERTISAFIKDLQNGGRDGR